MALRGACPTQANAFAARDDEARQTAPPP